MKVKKPFAVMMASAIGASTLTLGLGFQATQAATTQVTIPEPAMTTLDPEQYGSQVMLAEGGILEGLYRYNLKNQIIPALATGYKISNHGLTWTFSIRKGDKWSNGDPVTAKDFYFSYMRQLNPANSGAELWAGVLNDVANGYAYHSGAVPLSQLGIKVINDYTLQISTSTPVDLLPYLVEPGSYPLDPKIVDAHSNWATSANFPSDGPYMVKSFTPNGDITLVKNPDYLPGPQDMLGNVSQINIVPTPTVPLEDFLAHKLDVALLTNPSDVKYVQSHSNLKPLLHSQPTDTMYSLRYDKSVASSPLLTNLKLRQAIAEAIDRAPIAKNALVGMVTPASIFATPGWPTAKYEHGLPFNVAKAQQLLSQAGYPNGKGLPTFNLYCEVQASDPYQVTAAEALAQELKQELGLNFKIDTLSSTVYGALDSGGSVEGIKPGYFIGVQGVLRQVPGILVMQQNIVAGTYLYPVKLLKLMYQWQNTSYNPYEVKRYGNPTSTKLGVTWNDWIKMNSDALKDIRYLNAYNAKLPQYDASTVPLMKQWQTVVDSWRTAKTDAAKNAAWQTAWKILGTYETSVGSASIGWNEQVIEDKMTPKGVQNWLNEQTTYQASPSLAKAAPGAAKIVNYEMKLGWTEPLFYANQLYVANSNISGVSTNPWNMGNFYNLQSLTVK